MAFLKNREVETHPYDVKRLEYPTREQYRDAYEKNDLKAALRFGINDIILKHWNAGNNDSRIIDYIAERGGGKKALEKHVKIIEDRLFDPNLSKEEYNRLNRESELYSAAHTRYTGSEAAYNREFHEKRSLGGFGGDPAIPTIPQGASEQDKLASMLALTTADDPKELYTSGADRATLDAYVESLEDPFSKSREQIMSSMASRGLLDSGIKEESMGELLAAYNEAKDVKAGDLSAKRFNQLLSSRNLKEEQSLQNWMGTLKEAFASSGQTANQFYAENQAAINQQLQNYSAKKESNYEYISGQYQQGTQDYWDNLNASSNLIGQIGSVAGSYLGGKFNSPSTVPSTYDSNLYSGTQSFGSHQGRTNAINDLDKYKNFSPWNSNKSPFYGITLGG